MPNPILQGFNSPLIILDGLGVPVGNDIPGTYGYSTYGSGTYGGTSFQSVFPTSLVYLSVYGSATPFQLSSQMRTFSVKRQRLGSEQRLAGGTLVRDLGPVKRTVSISWQYLPHRDLFITDGGIGYYTLYNQLYLSNGKLQLAWPDGLGGQNSMVCYISASSSATPFRVDRPGEKLFWNVKLELEEV